MKKKVFFQSTSVLFFVVGTIHLVRALSNWPFVIGTYSLPIWLSYVAGVVLLYLATQAYRFSKSK